MMPGVVRLVDNQSPDQRSLSNAKHIYALSMWSVEKRPTGWYFSKSAYHGDKHDWRGPYSSEMSVTLMIARQLVKEIKKRHAPQSME
jgi:hypothetical protein